jgi:hypothetical protein
MLYFIALKVIAISKRQVSKNDALEQRRLMKEIQDQLKSFALFTKLPNML